MTALPSNLAFVGEDLARAISRDAHRSARRRRSATIAIAIAVLVITATAAVANGWLFDETPTLRAIPSLGGGQVQNAFAPRDAVSAVANYTQSEAAHRAAHPGMDGSAPLGFVNGGRTRTLLSDLGPEHRVLISVETTTGGICLVLSGFSPVCVATFKQGQQITWLAGTPSNGAAVLYGLARDDVTAVEADLGNGRTVLARLANNAFYVELPDGAATSLVIRLRDGSSEVVPALVCPLTNIDCTTVP